MERKEAIRREGVIDRVKETSPHTPDGVECPWVKEIFVRLKLSRLRLVLRFGFLPLRPETGFMKTNLLKTPPYTDGKLRDVANAGTAGEALSPFFDFTTSRIKTC